MGHISRLERGLVIHLFFIRETFIISCCNTLCHNKTLYMYVLLFISDLFEVLIGIRVVTEVTDEILKTRWMIEYNKKYGA